MQRGVWATQRSNEAKLNEAFDSVANVILIFSVNRTRHFQVVHCAKQEPLSLLLKDLLIIFLHLYQWLLSVTYFVLIVVFGRQPYEPNLSFFSHDVKGCAKMTSRIGGYIGGENWKHEHGTAQFGRNFSVKWLKVHCLPKLPFD